jgi:hypothetical protein
MLGFVRSLGASAVMVGLIEGVAEAATPIVIDLSLYAPR